jgi:hypothetical protein
MCIVESTREFQQGAHVPRADAMLRPLSGSS